MRTLLNEGRVVGLSAYELYVRNSLALDPEANILSEKAWLSSNVGSGCSMIMKVASGTTAGYHDYILPQGSNLCGCSVIYGSIFEGEPLWENSGIWARKVVDYGRLVENIPDNHPVTPGQPEDIPAKSSVTTLSEKFRNQCLNYLKITSALMFQPGQWNDNLTWTELCDEYGNEIMNESFEEVLAPTSDDTVLMNLIPNFSERGFVRLAISETLTEDVYILFTGLLNKTVVSDIIGTDNITSENDTADGDFLGPAMFPWSCKVVLTVTTDVFKAYTDRPTEITLSNSNTKITFKQDGNGNLGYILNGSFVML